MKRVFGPRIAMLALVGSAAGFLYWMISLGAGLFPASLVIAGLLPTFFLAWLVTGEHELWRRVPTTALSRSVRLGIVEIILGFEGLVGWEVFFGAFFLPHAGLRFFVLFIPSTFLMLDGLRRIMVRVLNLEKE